jgi:hypothetical protein
MYIFIYDIMLNKYFSILTPFKKIMEFDRNKFFFNYNFNF